MATTVSDVRRRARYYALQGGSRTEMAQGIARSRRLMVLVFQLAVIGFLGVRGFPAERLLVHGGVCVFYLMFCRYPTPPFTYRDKVRVLMAGLLAYLGWIANTGGLASPLMPLALSMLSPATVMLESTRQKRLFVGGALAVLVAVAFLSHTPAGGLVPPLVLRGGQASPEYLLIAAGAIIVTGMQVSSFWYKMTAAYDQVALELGTRREELCSESEDRTRDFEGAAARLAHELKNPLASIKCLSTHLARGHVDGKLAERLKVVSAEANRLEAIVDSFLSLSRGLVELNLAPIRPHDIARELKLLLDIRAREAGLALEVTGRADVEIAADAKKIGRVLFYLVVNAMQASSRGQTVTIDVGPACLVSGRTVIKVIDRGEGMSSDVLQRMQRPYFTTREGGTGLGVAMARALVEQHGGRLAYQSTPGAGTTVSIELPRSPPAGGMQKLVPDALRRPSDPS
jgi:signal transduction histidine kinase